MRLWHYKLIKVLPNKQLIGQWRECSSILGMCFNKKFKNHPIVKRIDGNYKDLYLYTMKVKDEMIKRGYKPNVEKFLEKYYNMVEEVPDEYLKNYRLFEEWHNYRYYRQCYYNLQEKYDLGLISEKEFKPISFDFETNSI